MNIQYSNIINKILVIGGICLLLIIYISACDKKEAVEETTASLPIETTTMEFTTMESVRPPETVTKETTVSQTRSETTSSQVEPEETSVEETTREPLTQPTRTEPPTTLETTSITATTESVGLPVVEATSASHVTEQKYTGTISVRTNSASGTEVYGDNGTTVDASNKASGYIMVKHEGSSKRIKLQIINGTTTYTYDLNNNGTYEAFPLQMGDGTYTIRTLENVSGTSYSILYSTDAEVALSNSHGPYLYPNQRVRFHSSMEAVKKSYDLTVGLTTDEEKVNVIYNYIVETIKYDYSKVSNLNSTYLSNADTTLANKAGICLDYSVLMAVMLRAQGIPTQVVYGSATEASWHAWNKIYYNGTWVLKDATFAAGGGKGTNYTESQRY